MSWRLQTAYHEAGHAVAAYLAGDLLVRVSVVQAGDTAGYVLHRQARELTPEEQAERLRASLVIVLAGEAACSSFADAASGTRFDDDDAIALAVRIAGGERVDADAAMAIYCEARDEAEWLARDWATAIGDVAREFDFFGVLEGEPLRRIVTEKVEADRASAWGQERRRWNQETRAVLAEVRKGNGNQDSSDDHSGPDAA